MAGKRGKTGKKPECKRCKAQGLTLTKHRFCPTCQAVVDAAKRKIDETMGAPKHPRKNRGAMKDALSPEERERRGAVLRQFWADVKAGRRPHPRWGNKEAMLAKKKITTTGVIPPTIEKKLDEPPAPAETAQIAAGAKAAAQREMAARELARRKLIHFTTRMNPRYLAGWFHIDLAERLERFFEDCWLGKSPRLMVFAPPRHGKSKLVSEEGPAWALGHYPDLQVIACSYGDALARDFSYKVQERIRTADYELLFPKTRLRPGKESIDMWRLDKTDGQYIAAGVGGPITGKGGNALIIDDPFKNREEADSALVRQAVHAWYTSTAYTRLAPGGGVLIMHTRWHDDDLAGRLLDEMRVAEKQAQENGAWPEDADRWEIVSYPAIAVEDEKHRKVGQALHPERYKLSDLLKIKRTLGPRDWSALYQQNPVPDEGGYFSNEHIVYYDNAPQIDSLAVYGSGDLAISKKESADHTVLMIAGLDQNDDLWLLDMVRGRFDSMEIIQHLFALDKQYGVKLWGIEEGQITTALGPFIEKRMREERKFLNIEPMKLRKQDKETRARAIQGRMRQGKVRIPRNAPWTTQLITEMLKFPNAVQNDCVDAVAWLGQMLGMMHIQKPTTRKIPSWRDKLNSVLRQDALRGSAMAA